MNCRRIALAGLVAGTLSLSFGFAACGGDDDDGGSSASSGGTGTDEKYVQSVCQALLNFQNDLEDLAKDNADASEDEAAKLIVKPLEKYVAALKKAKPPADAVDFHAHAVTQTEKALKGIRDDKNLDALDSVSIGETSPASPAVRDRLRAASDQNKTCQEADFSIS